MAQSITVNISCHCHHHCCCSRKGRKVEITTALTYNLNDKNVITELTSLL